MLVRTGRRDTDCSLDAVAKGPVARAPGGPFPVDIGLGPLLDRAASSLDLVEEVLGQREPVPPKDGRAAAAARIDGRDPLGVAHLELQVVGVVRVPRHHQRHAAPARRSERHAARVHLEDAGLQAAARTVEQMLVVLA